MNLSDIKIAVSKLPESAPAFLSFKHNGVAPVTSVYGNVGLDLSAYVYIGSDGEGSPICVNLNDHAVYILDHEFDFKPIYVNDSIATLERFIRLYDNYIDHVNATYGEDAFYNGNYPLHEIDALQQKFASIDAKAAYEPSFWGTTLDADMHMLKG